MVASVEHASPGCGMAVDTRLKLRHLLERVLAECPRVPAGLKADIERELAAKPGRAPAIDSAEVMSLLEKGVTPQMIAVKLKVAQATVYRAIKRAKEQ